MHVQLVSVPLHPVSRLALAELAVQVERPELAWLCRWALEHGGRLDPAALALEQPGLTERAAENLLRACAAHGLCSPSGELSELGREAARGRVLLPEQGVYALHWLAHPLLGPQPQLLHAERVDARTRPEALGEPSPCEQPPERARLARSLLEWERSFVLVELLGPRPVAEYHGKPWSLRIRWSWSFEGAGREQRWLFEGRCGGREVVDEERRGHKDSWRLLGLLLDAVLPEEAGRWDGQARRLRLPFPENAQGDWVERFEADWTPPEVPPWAPGLELDRPHPGWELPGLGSWEEVRIEGLPLGPASAEDARAWAWRRFERRLSGGKRAFSREELRGLWAEVVEDSPLEPVGPVLPAHKELLGRLRERPELYWRLAAPVDLAPSPPEPELLGAFRPGRSERGAGEGAGAPPSEADGGFGLRLGQVLAMEELVGRLLPEEANLVVLCDRYARGRGNLDALERFVAALRERAPRARLRVLSERGKRSEEDRRRIAELTGAEPLDYERVFGSERSRWPHDRYLFGRLFAPGRGLEPRVFAWQLSNSLLDGRPSRDGLLRWRDLRATPIEPDQLPPDCLRLLGDLPAGGGPQ